MLLRFGRLTCICTLLALAAFTASATTERTTQSLSQALQQFNMVQSHIGDQILNASPDIKIKASEIPTIPTSAAPGPQLVSTEQKTFLLEKIVAFEEHAKSEESLYTRYAVGFVIAAAVLALSGAILSFARQHTVAGVAGLAVTAIIGFSNAYPFNALSDFYRGLNAQSAALQIECELKQPFTTDSYNSAANQLQLLYLFEGKRPGLANYKVPLQNLTNDLQTVKTSSDTVEKTRAVLE